MQYGCGRASECARARERDALWRNRLQHLRFAAHIIASAASILVYQLMNMIRCARKKTGLRRAFASHFRYKTESNCLQLLSELSVI